MDTYHSTRERVRALEAAPLRELTEDQFRQELADLPVKVLRQAAVRWSAPRGRTKEAVVDGIVEALKNPHINQGDSYRVALGHVLACEQRMSVVASRTAQWRSAATGNGPRAV